MPQGNDSSIYKIHTNIEKQEELINYLESRNVFSCYQFPKEFHPLGDEGSKPLEANIVI